MPHTPEPWTVGPCNARGEIIITGSPDAFTPCQVIACVMPIADDEGNMTEGDDNARLIATAPKLLAAAKVVLAGLDARIVAAGGTGVPVFNGIAELHDAIGLATGETP
jgi:hypothetical protein